MTFTEPVSRGLRVAEVAPVSKNVAETLLWFAERPHFHVEPVSFETVRAYLSGLRAGLAVSGVAYSWEDYRDAAASRGWDCRGSEGIVRDFRRKELTDGQMVGELVAVEAEAYRLAAARRDEAATSTGE